MLMKPLLQILSTSRADREQHRAEVLWKQLPALSLAYLRDPPRT